MRLYCMTIVYSDGGGSGGGNQTIIIIIFYLFIFFLHRRQFSTSAAEERCACNWFLVQRKCFCLGFFLSDILNIVVSLLLHIWRIKLSEKNDALAVTIIVCWLDRVVVQSIILFVVCWERGWCIAHLHESRRTTLSLGIVICRSLEFNRSIDPPAMSRFRYRDFYSSCTIHSKRNSQFHADGPSHKITDKISSIPACSPLTQFSKHFPRNSDNEHTFANRRRNRHFTRNPRSHVQFT